MTDWAHYKHPYTGRILNLPLDDTLENHGFVRPDSFTDEYRRIFEVFERSLKPGGKR